MYIVRITQVVNIVFQGERGRHIRRRVQRTLLHGTSIVADIPGVQAEGHIQEAGGHAFHSERRQQRRLE